MTEQEASSRKSSAGDEALAPDTHFVGHHRFFDFTHEVQRKSFAELSGGFTAEEISFGLILRRVSKLLSVDAEREVLKPVGLSWAGFRVCVSLWVNGPQQPGEVAQATSMSRAGVSMAMKQLVASGLVETTPSEHDLRAIIMELTELGVATFEAAFAHHLEITGEWFAPLTVPEQQQLIALLGKVMLSPRAAKIEPSQPLNA